ncbi:MAG: Mur ligase domain-containing protein, partial [Deltaproteobacteria bacterium]|nr:Mur ligase domain-containing protein [Deltaproteobacteria bacterium]
MAPNSGHSGISLSVLAGRLGLKALGGEALVSGLTEDSRQVRPGDIFAAVKGQGADGRNFIVPAQEAGAAAVMLEEPDLPAGPRLLFQGSSGFRKAVSRAAREVYGFPDKKMDLIGITGTNGKSTIAYLLENIFELHGLKTGVIGTINYRWPGQVREAVNTTPEGPLLFRTLAEMAQDHCRAAVMEVSSHALELGRVDGLEFSAAVFTNLTQDHLDFHKDFVSYFAAKKKLFLHHLKKAGGKVRAAAGVDDSYGQRLREELGQAACGFGFAAGAEIRGSDLHCGLDGLRFKIQTPWGSWEQTSPLIGAF